MQQTETYKLNLIETSDTFSPEALNENAQKIEAALGAAGAALSAEANARAAGDAALDQRVTVLEATRLVFGSYKGTISASNPTQTIALGFTPRAVFVIDRYRSDHYIAIRSAVKGSSNSSLTIVENGFSVSDSLNKEAFNDAYIYMAIT